MKQTEVQDLIARIDRAVADSAVIDQAREAHARAEKERQAARQAYERGVSRFMAQAGLVVQVDETDTVPMVLGRLKERADELIAEIERDAKRAEEWLQNNS